MVIISNILNIHHSLNKKGFETFMSQNNIFSCWKFSEFPFYYFGMGFLLFLCRTQNSNREALSNIKTKIKYVQKLRGQVNNLKKYMLPFAEKSIFEYMHCVLYKLPSAHCNMHVAPCTLYLAHFLYITDTDYNLHITHRIAYCMNPAHLCFRYFC